MFNIFISEKWVGVDLYSNHNNVINRWGAFEILITGSVALLFSYAKHWLIPFQIRSAYINIGVVFAHMFRLQESIRANCYDGQRIGKHPIEEKEIDMQCRRKQSAKVQLNKK